MNEIPDEVEDLRFAILDNSDPKNPDYFFIPLIFLESFNNILAKSSEVICPIDLMSESLGRHPNYR